MRITTLVRRLVLSGLVLALASCSDFTPQSLSDASARSLKGHSEKDHRSGSALVFNGVDANTSTPLGTIVTTQIDDISYAAKVRYDGPNTADSHQVIFYNGHGSVTGWGILVLGPSHRPEEVKEEGTLAILAGGIAVVPTPLVLKRSKWQHVYAERRAGVVTISLDGQEFSVGSVGVNPVASGFAGIERTGVGGDGTFDAPTGDFHGAVDWVSVWDLAGDKLIEHWSFSEGRGPTTKGVKGTVLRLGTTSWTRTAAHDYDDHRGHHGWDHDEKDRDGRGHHDRDDGWDHHDEGRDSRR